MTLEYINLSHKFNCPLTKVPSHHHEELSSIEIATRTLSTQPQLLRVDTAKTTVAYVPAYTRCGILVFARAMGNLKSRAHDGTVTSSRMDFQSIVSPTIIQLAYLEHYVIQLLIHFGFVLLGSVPKDFARLDH